MHVELLTHASGDMTSWAVSPSLFHAQSKANKCIARSKADHQTRSMKRKESIDMVTLSKSLEDKDTYDE